MFCIYLRTNSDLCHLQHKLIGFYNRDDKCLLRGTYWIFKYSGLRFVFKGLKKPWLFRLPEFRKIRAVGAELVYAGVRTDRQADGNEVSSFLQFWERAQKAICSVVGSWDFPQEGRACYWTASFEGSVVTTAVDSPTRGHTHAACSEFEVQNSCTYLPLQAIPK